MREEKGKLIGMSTTPDHVHEDGDCKVCNAASVDESFGIAMKTWGWAATGVFDPDAPEDVWVYSTGLSSLYHAELVVSGLPPQIAHDIIVGVVSHLDDGHELEVGKIYTDMLQNDYPLAVIEVDDVTAEDYPHNMTIRYFGEDFKAYQLVWPDRERRMPWDEGYDNGLVQRLFGEWVPAE
jgi:hypothetical protein